MRQRKGLTLIEVILSIMLLGIIAISILPMFIHVIKFSKWNIIRQNAMSMAYAQVEWLKTLDYSTELELKGKYFPVGKDGISLEGVVKEELFMNDESSNPKIIDGVEYRFLTNIYWESGISSTGETVANALRKIDVTVKAKEPFSGKEKEYSIIGTLIAFEGERSPDNATPLKVKAFTGHDFTQLTKNVKIEIYNESKTTLKDWGRTDEKGEAIFVKLLDGKYQVSAKEWEKGEMMGRPSNIKGSYPNEEWISYDLIQINKSEEPYIEHSIFVDYPAYIKLHGISESMLLGSELRLEPIYNAPEGKVLNLDLKTNLNNLDNLKIWRAWQYRHSLTYNDVEYKLIDKNTRKVWDGVFSYYNNNFTIKDLTLGYVLESKYNSENIYKFEGNNMIILDIVFPESISSEKIESKIGEPAKFKFSLYDEDVKIPFNLQMIQRDKNSNTNKYKIYLNANYIAMNGKDIIFMLDESILDDNGIGMIGDMNFITLKHSKNNNQ